MTMQWTKIRATANSLILSVLVNISPANAQYSANIKSHVPDVISHFPAPTLPYTIAQQQLDIHSQPSFEDLPQLLAKRTIKVLVVNHPAYYFIYQSRPRGLAYDMMREYEKRLNKRHFKDTKLKLNILFIPVPSSQIINLLEQGYGDIAIGPLMTPLRQQNQVTHTEPIYTDNQLLVVSHKSTTAYKDIKQLSGKEIWIRRNSIYHQQLKHINKQLFLHNKPPINIHIVSDELEDFEILAMVNNKQIFMTMISNHSLRLWKRLYKNIKIHTELAVGSHIPSTWAVRNNTPQLTNSLNQFIAKHKKGTKIGNILHRRYLMRHPWLKKVIHQQFENRYLETEKIIKKYAKQYKFDWQLILAQAYQESRLNQKAISHRGAVGVMQVLPSTANEPYVNIKNINKVDSNIHAGVKYLHFMHQRYFNHDNITELDSLLLSFAAYNAGPTKLIRLRKRAIKQGLNPNIWFNHVEKVAAEVIGRETVDYVNNIYKFYITYLLASRYQINETQLAQQQVANTR
ncbi:lytic transglycosylase F [Moritella marina ATCC 15381]|uniref:Lytic transglycosylase F n=1 Tax=Moritella marina ATCC 15381 TaxID=1202962 RepID=A0A5J6WLP9_MORMI|nr:lytic transglycosylase F [Moritella marina]QFI38444.1 lytic transglycosylase F [Moritella marina ATCC 15381]